MRNFEIKKLFCKSANLVSLANANVINKTILAAFNPSKIAEKKLIVVRNIRLNLINLKKNKK